MINDVFFTILLGLLWYQWLAATAISSGYHRYFSHKAFKAPKWYEYYVLLVTPLSGSGPALTWVGVHRMHHTHSDTAKDPHSPKYKGALTVLTSTFKVKSIPRRFVKDMLRNKTIIWFYKHHLKIRILSIICGFVLLPFNFFFAFFIMPWLLGHLGYGLINYLCHKDGLPRNSIIANILTGGEGWHKNHHTDAKNYRIGKKWWQFDPGALWINLIKIS